MTIGVYCIENTENGKKYIGKSVNIERRLKIHRSLLRHNKHFNSYLQASLNVHGELSFSFYIIIECNRDKISELEIYHIKEYNTRKAEFGFNLTDGGEGMLGNIPSEETRLKRSNSLKGVKFTQERKDNISKATIGKRVGSKNPNYGKHPSEETRYKIGSGMRGKKHSESTKLLWKKNRTYKSGENHHLYGTKKSTSSKYYCVYKRIYDGKYISWLVYFYENKVFINIGAFKSEEAAARAYDEYVKKHNLSRPLNFPEENQ